MSEEFIYYLWKHKLLEPQLQITTGENCKVIDPGLHNTNSGPDFFNARIKIGNTLWAGNVEIHVHSSDWKLHKHQFDKAYDNVILHVVFVEDKKISRENGEAIPTLEIADKFNSGLLSRYKKLMQSKNRIPCEFQIRDVDRFQQNNWLDRLLIERLEIKSQGIEDKLEFNNNDWAETFYQQLASNFGFKVNAVPFELLARSIPIIILAKHKNNNKQVEALLFGQAGMLGNNTDDSYYQELKKEYIFLAGKYKLVPIDAYLWRFMRLRPANFPTIRISQFADLIANSSHLFSKILEYESFEKLIKLFNVAASDYWNTHFTFGKESEKKAKKLGKTGIHLILINTIAPFLFVYGRKKNEQAYIDKAIKLLDQIPGERNAITRLWADLELNTNTAFNTQALLHLKNKYCDKKQCLSCGIGHAILNQRITD